SALILARMASFFMRRRERERVFGPAQARRVQGSSLFDHRFRRFQNAWIHPPIEATSPGSVGCSSLQSSAWVCSCVICGSNGLGDILPPLEVEHPIIGGLSGELS